MTDIVDDVKRTPLVRHFTELGIPNFLVAQALCLIEGNLMHQKETQLEELIPNNADILSSKSRRKTQKISDQHSVAISLLVEIWMALPVLFSSP